MTRRLILTRHAKSVRGEPAVADHDRALDARGLRAAAAIGHWLAELGHVPDAALLSTARRVRETWDGLRPAFGRDVATTWAEGLYLASPKDMVEVLSSQQAACMILIAHNPGIGSLAGRLAQDPPRHRDFDRFPTGATLVVEFEAGDWSGIRPRSGRVVDFTVPGDLAD